MAPDRDVAAFDARAKGYEQGWLGRLHHEIVDRTLDLALGTHPDPRRVLDIGCGTGYLLQRLGDRCPEIQQLEGIDPASSMVEIATATRSEGRMHLTRGVAEHLPFSDGAFDLVVSTTSFDHWSDQQAGLRECARVLEPSGHLTLVDQFSLWLAPTLVVGRREKARTTRRATTLLEAAGFRSLTWHDVYAVIIKAVTAQTLSQIHDE